ncbi:hypothetical protein GR927_18400 [Mycolicibacterium sp. 3033]|nr:hypothetical protein [Mycolicibacterium aurantiacum]
MADGDTSPDSDDSTRILRRAPSNTGAQPAVSRPPTQSDPPTSDPPTGWVPAPGPQPPIRPAPPAGAGPPTGPEPPTGLIRRHPTGAQPAVDDPATQIVPRAKPIAVGPSRAARADPTSAIATSVASIVSGWATAVIATDLITGWWATDPLFCVAVGFLTTISAAATIAGVIALLLRQRNGRLLVVVGAVIALLIFASLFVAGAALPALVYAMPVLPLASIVAALLPATGAWNRSG